MAKKTKKRRPRRGLPKGAHRVRIEVFPHVSGHWYVAEDSMFIGAKKLKAGALAWAIKRARAIAAAGGFASVRIHDKRGRLVSERTYPRSSDPFPPRG